MRIFLLAVLSGAMFALYGIVYDLSVKVTELENAPQPELIHTCQLFDNRGRQVCGYIDTSGD